MSIVEHASPAGRPWMLYNARSDFAASAYWSERDDKGREIITHGIAAESDSLADVQSWADRQIENGAASCGIYRMIPGLLGGEHRENFPVLGSAA